MENLRAYRIFQFEMKDLSTFLYSTRYAFQKTESLRDFLKNKENKQFLEDNKFDTKPCGFCSFKRNSVLSLEKTLNQQTLVRAISALEIFLIDLIRDVFVITKIPFKDQSKIHNYNQSQILSTQNISELFNHIINKECRNLSSGGFNEIIKLYKRRLNIDLLHVPPGKSKMVEYHELRHLIVHRLGRTDSQFRKKYNLGNKVGISIDVEHLKQAIKDIRKFADVTHQLVLNRLKKLKTSTPENKCFERKVKYKIILLNPDHSYNFLNYDFEFWVNDDFEVLKNILVDKKVINKNEIEIVLAGEKIQIKAYYSHLKFAKKKQDIKCKIIEDSSLQSSSKSTYIDDDTLDVIRHKLPEQPWETGVHKKIANELGYKNSFVSTAIRILINKGFFKQQISGKIIENDEAKIP
jgi:hypothetical protein